MPHVSARPLPPIGNRRSFTATGLTTRASMVLMCGLVVFLVAAGTLRAKTPCSPASCVN